MSTSVDVELPASLSRPEELVNSITHALGLVLSIVGTAVLLDRVARYGDSLQVVGVSIYGATLVALYAASTLSHSFVRPRLRHFFRTVDQVCIFLLIAGTFTPIALTYFCGGWWWALFLAVWGLALGGIFFKLFFTRLQSVSVSAYVLLGWLPIVAIKPIVQIVPGAVLGWVVAGGLLYTLGTLFLMRDDRVPYFHAAWHVFVIAASACHYYAILCLVPTAT
ncbi:MAG: hemolysin III family protein [Pirellulales bacterium]